MIDVIAIMKMHVLSLVMIHWSWSLFELVAPFGQFLTLLKQDGHLPESLYSSPP